MVVEPVARVIGHLEVVDDDSELLEPAHDLQHLPAQRQTRVRIDDLDGDDGRLRQTTQELRGRAAVRPGLDHEFEGNELQHPGHGGLPTFLAFVAP